MAPQQQLIKLIRLGMIDLASSPRAKVYCAANRGNMHLIPVKIIDFQHIPNNIFLTPYSLYANICKNKPFAEAGIGGLLTIPSGLASRGILPSVSSMNKSCTEFEDNAFPQMYKNKYVYSTAKSWPP